MVRIYDESTQAAVPLIVPQNQATRENRMEVYKLKVKSCSL